MQYKHEDEYLIQSQTTILEPVREEWTKYFVNEHECTKEDIYPLILEKGFYNGQIRLTKKYHFSHQEESATEERFSSSRNSRRTSKQSESNDKSANFSLETKKFADKFTPSSHEYKLLISNMVYTLDMFYDTSIQYEENAKNLQFAIRHCMTFFSEKISESDTPYDTLFSTYLIENVAFIFDILAYFLSKNKLSDNQSNTLPSLQFDTSSIKETWDPKWSNAKKSQFLELFLSCMLKQTEVLYQQFNTHGLCTDNAIQNVIKDKFDALKETIDTFQIKKNAIDSSLSASNQSMLSNIASFFYQTPSNERETNSQPSPTEYLI